MERRIPEKLKDTLTVYRSLTVKDSLVILLALIVSLLITKADASIRICLIMLIDPLILSLLIPVNGERLYVTAFYILRYFICKNPYLYIRNKKNNSIREDLKSAYDEVTVSAVSCIPFSFLSEERQDGIIRDLSYAIRSLGSRDAYIISLERKVKTEDYIMEENVKLTDLYSRLEAGLITYDEFNARKEIISSSVSSLRRISSDGVKSRCFYLVTGNDDAALRDEIRNALRSSGADLKDLSEDEKLEILEEYSGIKNGENVKVNLSSYSVKKEKQTLLYITGYPDVITGGFGSEFTDVPMCSACLCLRKENGEIFKRKADSALLETATGKAVRESERLKKERYGYSLKEVLEDLENGESLNSFTLILRCSEKDKKEVISLLKKRGIKATVRYGRVYEILKKFLFGVSSFKEKNFVSSLTSASFFPFSSMDIRDEKGILLGAADGPVFTDFLKTDDMHLNSNMVVIGKSGSGKSYFAKSLISKLACTPSKIFILDPEGEYTKLTSSLSGETLNVGDGNTGHINPFEIRGEKESATFYSHLQFLEELYRLLFPGIPDECTECLNTHTLALYKKFGITPETDFNLMDSSSFPLFSDLYLLMDKEEKTELIVKTLSFLSKVSNGGMNSNILDGYTDITFERSITDFSFTNLTASQNRNIINANLLVILKFLEGEALRKKDTDIKTVIVIDEAHLFIDEKYPAALDFMFSMAKRIRKYNGLQIVITQNLKDFSLSGEIKRKSEALISVSQYSLIFPSSPQDVKDITELYRSTGGITEKEQEIISTLKRGTAFFIKNPKIRTVFKVITEKETEEKFI